MIRDHRLFCLSLLFLLFSVSLFSSPITVKEVRTNIFEKQVTGYRLTLPHPRPLMRQGIRDWLAEYQSTPATFDDILIYENINYPPVTQTKEITLYYLVEDVEGVFTQLTIVGMYDYQNSIDVAKYPDLTLRMLLDLSKMIESISGDIIDFDPIFSETSADDLVERYKERKEQHSLDYFLDRKDNQIEDFGETRMKENPFEDNNPELFESEDEIVTQIALRFDDYLDRGNKEASPFTASDKLKERQVFIDSISSLYQKISQLQETLVDQQQNLLKAATQLEESMAEPEVIYDTVYIEVESKEQIKMWQDSVKKLNRDLQLRKKTIDHLQDDIEGLQIAKKPEVKYVKDTVLVTVMDRQENLVLKIENQSLMDSLLLFREKLNSKETTISNLQKELTVAEAHASQPSIIRDTVTVTVPADDSQNRLALLAERHAWKDSIRQINIRLFQQQNENARLRQQIQTNQVASSPEKVIIRDTIFQEVAVEDLAMTDQLRNQNNILEDSLLKNQGLIAAQNQDISRLKRQINLLQKEQATPVEPTIIRDTIFEEIFIEDEALSEELRNQNSILEDSLKKNQGLVAAQTKDISRLRKQISLLQEAQTQPVEPTVIRDTIFEEIFVEDEGLNEELRNQNSILEDSLRKNQGLVAAQAKDISRLRKQISLLQEAQPVEPTVIRDTVFQEIAVENVGITDELRSQNTVLEDSLLKNQGVITAQSKDISRLKKQINLLQKAQATPVEPTIIRDTVFQEIAVENEALSNELMAQNNVLEDSLRRKNGLLQAQGKDIAQLRRQISSLQKRTPETVVVRDTVFIEQETSNDELAFRTQNRSLQASLTDARKDLLTKELELEQLREQWELSQVTAQTMPQVLTDTLVIRDTIIIPNTDQEELATQKVFQDSIAYLRRVHSRMEILLSDRQTKIEVLQGQLAWVEDQPKIGYDTIYIEVPVQAENTDVQSGLADNQRQLVDSLSNLQSNMLEKDNRIKQLKQELKFAIDKPSTIDTVQVVDQFALEGLKIENKALEDSIASLIQENQRKSQQIVFTNSELKKSQAETESLSKRLIEAQTQQSKTPDNSQMWQDSVAGMQQQMGMMKQIMADRKDRIQQLKNDLAKTKDNPTVIHDTVEVEVYVESTSNQSTTQIDSLNRVANHWRQKATSTDSLLGEQTQHIGRLISVINNSRWKEDSLAQLISLQQNQIEQSFADEILLQRSQDSLQQIATEWEWRYEALRDSQVTQGATAELSSAAKEFKQEFFEDRISQLTEAQQALVQKEWKVESQIKRIQQREKFLADWETDPDQSKLLSRIADLETQIKTSEEARLTTLEMPKEPQNGLEIQSVYLFREGSFFPAYSVRTPLSANQLTIRIRQWFQKRSYKPVRGGKLLFEQVMIPELSPSPLDIAFEIIDQGSENMVLVSARQPDGTFLRGETGDLEGLRIRRLLYELFWFAK